MKIKQEFEWIQVFFPSTPIFWVKTEPGSSRVLGKESESSFWWAPRVSCGEGLLWESGRIAVPEQLGIGLHCNFELVQPALPKLRVYFFFSFLLQCLKLFCLKWGVLQENEEPRKFAVDTPKFFFFSWFWISCKTAVKQWDSKHSPRKHEDKQN